MASLERCPARPLYEIVSLLYALSPVRGARSVSGIGDWSIDPSITWRSFVDAVAYISAHCTGGDYVTAAAIQEAPTGMTIWLAGNKAIEPKVRNFLKSLLSDLAHIVQLDRGIAIPKSNSTAKEELLSRIIEFDKAKLKHYHNRVAKKFAPLCLDIINAAFAQDPLENVDGGRLSELQKWLEQRFKDKSSDISFPEKEELKASVEDCYALTRSHHVQTFRLLSARGQKGAPRFPKTL